MSREVILKDGTTMTEGMFVENRPYGIFYVETIAPVMNCMWLKKVGTFSTKGDVQYGLAERVETSLENAKKYTPHTVVDFNEMLDKIIKTSTRF